jgi:serine/threonine protein kinase
MTESDPALRSTVSARSPSALLALGLRDEGLDADALAAALPQYDDFRPLGAGGMGVVWSARHVQLDRKVAIKLMRPELAVDPYARRERSRSCSTRASSACTTSARCSVPASS